MNCDIYVVGKNNGDNGVSGLFSLLKPVSLCLHANALSSSVL